MVTVNNRTSMSQELTPTGGRSSGEEENTSSISTTRRPSMSIKTRTLKDKRLLSGESTTAGTRDGELSILTSQRRKQAKDLTKNMDSISTDQCTSDQDFQCRELLNLFHGMLDLEDTSKEEESNRLGDSIESLTPLET